jgi:proteasome assembly chaperone (PAC2) family protein
MWQRLDVEEQVRPKDPVLIVSLSTSMPQYRELYSQASELAKFMLRKMNFRRFASLYSSALPPACLIREDRMASLVADRFYYYSGKRDVVLLAGDSSPMDDQHEFSDSVLSYAKVLGVKELFSIGTRWTEQPTSPLEVPKVLGFSTDMKGILDLEASGVQTIKDEPAPFFASLIVGRAQLFGMRGYKLSVNHGEPLPHPKAVIEFLKVLGQMIGFEVDTSELEEQSRIMQEMLTSSSEGEPSPRRDGIYH